MRPVWNGSRSAPASATLKTDYDWLLDLELPDEDAAEKLIKGEAYRDTMRALSAATKYEWTARMTHQMHGH